MRLFPRAAALLLLAAALTAQTASDFLAKHYQPLSPDDFRPTLLDTAGKEVILLGESHGIAISNDLDLAFLQYLHETAGVRYYLTELSYSEGCLLNRYFDTGDEKLLDFMFRELHGTIAWTREYRDFFARMREWNLTLPAEKRVQVVAVDLEHQERVALWYLAELAKGREAPAAIRDTISRLAQLAAGEAPMESRFSFSSELAASLQEHADDYSALLGDDLFAFRLVAANLENAREYYGLKDSNKSNQLRDRVIYETFLKVRPRLAPGRFYGRWGAAHVTLAPSRDCHWFGCLLNRTGSPVAGKILGIRLIYRNSEHLIHSERGDYRVMAGSELSKLADQLAAASKSTLALFRVSGARDSSLAPGGVQYLVLIDGATAAHPLEGTPREPQTLGPAAVVENTVPENGSHVPPDTAEIRITFSREMSRSSMSWVVAGEGTFPKMIGVPAFEADGRTMVAKVKLEPSRTYAMWLNSWNFKSFVDVDGQPAVPYLLVFHTTK